MKNEFSGHARNVMLHGGVSLLALAMMGAAGAAQAQTSPPANAVADTPSQTQSSSGATSVADTATEDRSDDIVVVGVRQALASAQSTKKNADTVVDSISATDIGAFPDKSVAAALQRVPGITVSRLQSSDDSTHPSGEPAGVLIRGLPQVRTEFNGRDSFSADAARGLNFNDVSPELMAGVDAYKNQTAEMIEGGIAGTVNLRTRLPLDSKGLLVAGNVKATYGDRSKDWNYEYSGILSYSAETGAGTFGLLANYAHSHVVTRTESVIMDKIDTYCSDAALDPQKTATVGADGKIACASNPFGGTGWAYAPDGIRYSQVDYDRTRRGIALAAQYEDPTGDFRASVQYNDSKYRNAWLERASHTIFDGNYYGTPAYNPRKSTILGAAPGTSALVFGSNGMLQSGTLTQGHGSWRGSFDSSQAAIDTGSAVPGMPFVNYCGAGSSCTSLRDGLYFQNESRNFDHSERTQDLSGNIKWDVNDRLHLNLDVQKIWAHTNNNDILVATGSMANMDYSVDRNGTPTVKLLPGSNVNYAAGGLANPHNYWMPFIQGHVEDNDADEFALRGDVEYDLADGGWLNSLKVGVRYADRNQTVRYSTFNWSPIAAPWNCNGPGFNIDNTAPAAYPACAQPHADFKGYGAGIWESTDLGNGFFNGNVYDNGNLVYLNRPTLRNFDKLVSSLSGPNTNSPLGAGWSPICDRSGLIANSCFLPQEVMQVKEKTTAAYAMLRFGGDDKTIFGGINVQGNIGVRVVKTSIDSEGRIGFPAANIFDNVAPCVPGAPPPNGWVVNPACSLTPAIRAFANGGSDPNNFKTDYTNVLPTLNVRFGLDSKQFIRFAASRAMARPDFGLLRNFVSIQAPVYDGSASSPYLVRDAQGNVTGYNFVFRAESGFAGLKPVLADQFDLTYERYMGPSSSFTFGAFFKKLHNSIAYGDFTRTITNNGSTQTILLRGPRNEKGGGKLYGFEAAYQTFFDFLPGALKGLGAQLNYTFVKQSGINNSNLIAVGALDAGGTGGQGAGLDVSGGRGAVIDSHRLAGISDHTFNVVGLYEYGPVGLRLAYNWRSRFLTNNLDCCIGLPVFQKAAGFLDGSIRFSVNKYVELSIEGSNLLNTTTVYQQQIFGDTIRTPGAKPVYLDSNWGRVDRRFQFGARFKF
ncbi:TonB-dependent receptor [Sphingomonas sp. ERG5]|uniref:TonB-dependent receptor n=1 Tax=Sphingomonas sp. ERG5 TaxID=1381597 RepID=UPI00054C25C9|nr:TonB-dependent receptor [Sphingomonas sp. ERG5]